MHKNKLDEIYAESQNAAEYSKKYSEYLATLILTMDHDKVGQIVDLLLQAQENDKSIFFIGNGGSAATATHYNCDFGKGTKTGDKTKFFKTFSFADNVSSFTAIGNDDGYEYVFRNQLENFLKEGDIVFSISASGNSPNLIKAVEYAKEVGAITISLLGFDGGKLKDMSDIAFVIETRKGEYGPVEDAHMILDHIMSTYIFRLFKEYQEKN
ncbi:MAG TPA: SIS domain-containing protein [Alphaproteobacteria bacterium]|nr:SIS domain-containing protein [Alphaproteobacteria bacterium]